MCVDCTNSINDTPQGTSGEDGVSSYIYIATATDDNGSGFALYENNPTQCYKAILTSTTPIASPQASDFADLWFNTCGTPGTDGADGTGSTGARGDAASITLGTVATGAAGSNVIITNSGTTNDAVFNFTIPRGNTGSAGADGAVWTNGSGAPGSTLTVGDYYLDSDTGNVYTNTGSGNTIVANIMGATGATGAQGDPSTVESSDDSLNVSPVSGGYDITFNGLSNIVATVAAPDIDKVAYNVKGVVEDGQTITYTGGTIQVNGNTTSGSTVTCSFGSLDLSTGIFTFTLTGVYLFTSYIHLKSGSAGASAWGGVGEFGLGITFNDTTNILNANWHTITPVDGVLPQTHEIDITTQSVWAVTTQPKYVKVKVLNRTEADYVTIAGDIIRFGIVKLM